MNKIIAIIFLQFCFSSIGAELAFTGNSQKVIAIKPEASSGLEQIYVLRGVAGVTASYTSTAGEIVKWYRFGSSGGGNPQEITDVEHNGTTSSIQNLEGDYGYIVMEGNRQYCFWLVDYSKYEFSLNSITFPEEQDCGVATMVVDSNSEPITYYTVSGVPRRLSRDITVAYNTLEWDSDNKSYNTVETENVYENLNGRVVFTAPLCNTALTVRGDRFLKEWGGEKIITTDTYLTRTVEVQATATQATRENSNEVKEESTELGGSAPAEITFQSYATDAVVYKEWVFASDSEFSNVLLRLNDETVTYTFKEMGTFYVKFVGSNEDGGCQSESEVFQINIGESKLECPNVFSPNATEGINDEWKVSYKSIVSFSCWIFDRYGNNIISFTDPAMGWDGKYKGKYVKSGVYYYVIEASGADGKKYNLKGDINILKSNK